MAVISITITQSDEEIVAGIPKTVSISTNIPASIFYTLDGNDPTLFSDIYIGPIYLPIDLLSVTLKVLASNGVDVSPIVTETYVTNILGNTRLPHSATTVPAGKNIPGLYPFGTPPSQPEGQYLNPADAGITVDNPALPAQPTGFDGKGEPNAFTNEPYNIENYSIVYSTTNYLGETGKGIGNLPGKVTVPVPPEQPEETSQFTATFDPRAFVIFQDFEKENPEDPAQINKQFFSLQDPNVVRDGNSYFTHGLDAPPANGSFLRSHYNPRDNTMTYYYLDTWANRWIISKTPYRPTGNFDGNLSAIKFSGKQKGVGMVFQWLPFARRVLF
jgi:hypothetical protein